MVEVQEILKSEVGVWGLSMEHGGHPWGLVVETQLGGVPLSRGGLATVQVLLDNNLKDGSLIPTSWFI